MTIKAPYTIFFLIATICNSCQPAFIKQFTGTTREFWQKRSSMCSKSICLSKDHSYLYETGCENHSKVNTGTWKIKDSIIILHSDDPNNIKTYIKSIEKKGEKSGSITFEIKDKFNNPIDNFIILPFQYEDQFTIKGEWLFDKEVRKGEEPAYDNILRSNEQGVIKISRKKIQFFEFYFFKKITGKSFRMEMKDINANVVKIKLNTYFKILKHGDLSWLDAKYMDTIKLKDLSNGTWKEFKGVYD